jgi:uncharacterized membrane protein YkgB
LAPVTFTLPKQWEDWVSWILGMWLCISPWGLLFANDSVSTQNAVIGGLLLIVTEVVTLSVFEAWEEWINVALGIWLIASSWVLGIISAPARANFVAVGAVILGLALFELWQTRAREDSP